MKKYKLLKDLPLYPAGTIGEIRKLDDGVESIIKVKNDILVEIINSVELRTIREEGKFDEWFEEIEESKAWKPEMGEGYYYISSCGSVSCDTYDAVIFEEYAYEIGNCFKTEEEAEKAVEKLKALRRLREKGLKFTKVYKNYGAYNLGHILIKFDAIEAKLSSEKFPEDIQADLEMLMDKEEK